MSTHEQSAIKRFKQLQRDLALNYYLMSVVEFDGETVAPPKGGEARAEALAKLDGDRHELIAGADATALVTELEGERSAGALDDETALELAVFARDQRETAAIPADESAAWTRLTSEATDVWRRAKNANDWASFEPYVDKIVEALKHQASELDPSRDPYDVWLDQYERGMDAKAYDAFFDQVRATVVLLVHEIAQRPRHSEPFASKRVDYHAQMALARDLMELVGLDMDGAVLSTVEHPFSNGMAPGDARVTTHVYPENAISGAYTIMHESGHAIYEQHAAAAHPWSILGCGSSSGLHESQSRFFENYVGRSRAFMAPLLAAFRKHAPKVYGSVSEDELYRAANAATPGLIRMDADELTYPLHIMVRYDIERMLFAGEARACDVPGLWAKLYKEYLGLEVPDDEHGCLQDVHWSNGSFGYFPSYALGSAYGAQYLAAMRTAGIDFDAACASGDLEPIRQWLDQNIWSIGRGKDAAQLIEDACSKPFDASYYCAYLDGKFRELYGL